MGAKASDFDQTELDITVGLMTLLKARGRGTRYKIDLFIYAEQVVELSAAEERKPRRMFQVDPPSRPHRIIGQWDSAPTRPYFLRPEDLE